MPDPGTRLTSTERRSSTLPKATAFLRSAYRDQALLVRWILRNRIQLKLEDTLPAVLEELIADVSDFRGMAVGPVLWRTS